MERQKTGILRYAIGLLLLALAVFGGYPARCQAASAKQEAAPGKGKTAAVSSGAAGSWVTVKEKYYVKKNGSRVTGSYKIGDTYYIFDEAGRLFNPSAATAVKVGNAYYCVGKKGIAQSGWQILGTNQLCYAEKNGKLKVSTSFKGITFGKNGLAALNTNAYSKIKAMKVFQSITNSRMNQGQKLRACWNYLVGGGFRYAMKYPNVRSYGWQRKTALDMLNSHSGNCYSFACAFAALASEAGYNAYVVCGRVPGSRDGAADGYTRHAWVEIGGRTYDPEAQYAGWMRGVYGTAGYAISHSVSSRTLYER